jgi:putative DNA primase/helicase
MERIDTAALLARVDIVGVIDARVPLKKAGAEYEACCPFHTEDSPSFKVSPSKQIYHCFGCGANGDAIKFLQEYAGMTFFDACRELGADIPLPQGGPQPAQDAAARPPVQRESARPTHKESPWVAIIPAPDTAPEPPMAHVVRGKPEATWRYVDAEGHTIGFVYRFKTSDGGKETLPLLWAQNSETGELKWHWKAFPEPRPLYGLDRLAARPDATVLVVEGEKCADAGHAELPDLVVVSWPGGGKAVRKAFWQAMAGRRAVLWADCDAKRVPLSKAERESFADPVAAMLAQAEKPLLPESDQPGVKAMATVAEILLGLGCKVWSVRLPAPGEVADGWDIADAVAEGLTGAALADWVRERSVLLEAPSDAVAADAESTSPPSPAGAGPWIEFAEDDSWRGMLMRKDGRALDCRENIYTFLKHHPAWAGRVQADEFGKRIVLRGDVPMPWRDGQVWDADTDPMRLGMWLAQQEGLLVKSTENLAAVAAWVASEQKFHPVREYLDGLVWDGVERRRTWMADLLGAEPSAYLSIVSEKMLIGLVARIYQPGCLMRNMVILEGKQYRGKSTALRILGGEWFSDAPLDLNNKDVYQIIQGIWLFEIAELDAFNKAESTRIKNFISSPKDRFRAPYDRAPKDHFRGTVFSGSTNQLEYLKDLTGNTRYWPVRCEVVDDINLPGIAAARDQLFAEAVQIYRRGERWHITAEEQAAHFDEVQAEREILDPWEPLISRWLLRSGQTRVGMIDLLCDCLKIEPGKIGGARSESSRVGSIMHRLGWVKNRATSGDRDYYYTRPRGQGVGTAPAPAGIAASNGGDEDAPF